MGIQERWGEDPPQYLETSWEGKEVGRGGGSGRLLGEKQAWRLEREREREGGREGDDTSKKLKTEKLGPQKLSMTNGTVMTKCTLYDRWRSNAILQRSYKGHTRIHTFQRQSFSVAGQTNSCPRRLLHPYRDEEGLLNLRDRRRDNKWKGG